MSIDNAWDNEEIMNDFWNQSKNIVSKTGVNVAEVQQKLSSEKPFKEEKVNHPKHYNQGGIECIDAIESATIGLEGVEAFYTGNIIKYIWRWKYKNGIEDLKKIQFYLNRLIGYLERK